MRIGISAHFWPNLTVGSGQYLRHLVRALARLGAGHTFVLIGERGAFADGERPVETSEVSLGSIPAGRPAKLWFEQVAIPLAARRLGLDLLHVPYLAPPLFSPVPTVVTVHDLIPLLLPAYRGSWRKRVYTWLDVQSARRADVLVAVSEHTRQDAIHWLDYPAERIYVTPEAAAPDMRPATPEEVAAVRARLGLPQRFILYLGDTDHRKGVQRLIAAFSRWREACGEHEAALVVAGPLHRPDGLLFPDLPALVRSLGLERAVRFLGPVTEDVKHALYSAATLYVFLSEYEGFGLPPLEAMACGTPVLASNTSSLPEVVGQAGVLVDPVDEAAVVGALGRLMASDALRSEYGKRGLAQAATFSWERTALATLRAYEAAGRRNGARH
jgi:glycosyltransferase involved in cell wall biosynthesis